MRVFGQIGRLALGLGLGGSAAASSAAATFKVLLEDSSGSILMESGSYILLESAP